MKSPEENRSVFRDFLLDPILMRMEEVLERIGGGLSSLNWLYQQG